MDSLDIASDSWDQHSRVPEKRCMNVDLSESQCSATQILGAAVAPELRGGCDSKSAPGAVGWYAAGDRPAPEGRAMEIDQVGER